MGKAHPKIFILLLVVLVVGVSVIILTRESGRGTNNKRNGILLPPELEVDPKPVQSVQVQFPIPKPDPDDPAFKKLKAEFEKYLAALAAYNRIGPFEHEKRKEAEQAIWDAIKEIEKVGPNLVNLLLGTHQFETDQALRSELMGLVTRFCDAKTARLLLKHYHEFNGQDRRTMVRGFSDRDFDGLTEIFDGMILTEKEAPTKNDMIDYMLRKEDPADPLKDRLVELFEQTHDGAFRIHLVKAMPRYGDDVVLRDFYEDVITGDKHHLRIKRSAMYSFAISHGSDAVPALSRQVQEQDFRMRASAIKGLEFTKSKEAMEILEDLAKNDSDEKIRSRAASSLEIMKNPPEEVKPIKIQGNMPGMPNR